MCYGFCCDGLILQLHRPLLQVFLIVTLFGELWMAMMVGVIVFLYQFLVVYIKGEHVWQTRVSSQVHKVASVSRAASIDSTATNHVRITTSIHSTAHFVSVSYPLIYILIRRILISQTTLKRNIRVYEASSDSFRLSLCWYRTYWVMWLTWRRV